MSTIDIRDGLARVYSICDILGLQVKSQKIICPLPMHIHHNNTPSFSIKITRDGKEVFRCHGNCGMYGDVIDFVGYMNIAGYNKRTPAHLSEAAKLLTGYVPRFDPPHCDAPAGIDQSIMTKFLPPGQRVVSYYRARGISDEVAVEYKLGQKGGAMAIPSYVDGFLIGVKYRNLSQTGPRYWAEKGSKGSLYNHDKVRGTTDAVIVAKGEIAVLVLQSLGFLACCTTTGEGQEFPDDYVNLLAWSRKKIVYADNDPQEIRDRLLPINQEKARKLGAELLYPPDGYKDIDEWLIREPGAVEELKCICQS